MDEVQTFKAAFANLGPSKRGLGLLWRSAGFIQGICRVDPYKNYTMAVSITWGTFVGVPLIGAIRLGVYTRPCFLGIPKLSGEESESRPIRP